MNAASFATKDLVLVGGGHAHLFVLRHFGMNPVPGVRLTLVSRTSEAPYSGMLPGLIAGHYAASEMHFDLRRLAAFAGARFIRAEVTGLAAGQRELHLADRPPLSFDLLSLNVGITPSLADLAQGRDAVTPVKPIDEFHARWQRLEARALAGSGPFHLGIAGGGAAGVELACATRHRLLPLLAAQARELRVSLFTASSELLPQHPAGMRRRVLQALAAQQITVHCDARLVGFAADRALTADGAHFPLDELLWVTDAAAPAWLKESGLALDAQGFVRVDGFLRSVSHPAVFAAGDCASLDHSPRPKSGVYAVRAGMPLANNLARACRGELLKAFTPQRRALAILALGERVAIASRGNFCAQGGWVWRWKDWIDRRFMRAFQELPSTPGAMPASAASAPVADEPRCAGCGSKVAASVLEEALFELACAPRDDVRQGLATRGDVAVLALPPGSLLAQSIDGFRAFDADLHQFGRIAAAHALSDLYASGAQPHSALAYVTLPLASTALQVRDLRLLLAGVQDALQASGATLVGGHTVEGPELSLALAVNGVLPRDAPPRPGVQPGDKLVLTRPLGSGVLLAGAMRGMAPAAHLDALLATMVHTNAKAAAELARRAVHAQTDVTGFGLAGHLANLLEGGQRVAVLDLAGMPAYDGALDLLRQGVRSTLHVHNARTLPNIVFEGGSADEAARALVFDPQTSGGLLAALPPDDAHACVVALREVGCEAAVIGEIR